MNYPEAILGMTIGLAGMFQALKLGKKADPSKQEAHHVCLSKPLIGIENKGSESVTILEDQVRRRYESRFDG